MTQGKISFRSSMGQSSLLSSTWIAIGYYIKELQFPTRRCYFIILCSICIVSFLLLEFYRPSLFVNVKFWRPTSLIKGNYDPIALDIIQRNVSVACDSLPIILENDTLNMTIPNWTELLEEYVSLNITVNEWTLFQLPRMNRSVFYQKAGNASGTYGVQAAESPNLLALVNRKLAIWSPTDCDPSISTAIIVPYRNREEHIRVLLHNLPPFLIRQRLRFTIFVIEQMSNTRFNRALLLNVGFRESSRVGRFDCFVFHDVDLLPADPRVPYACASQPVHLAASMDKFNYRLPYKGYVGGVSAMTREQFEKVGGFSNLFFGWGGEDDDMYRRILKHNYTLFRPNVTRYKMIRHNRDKGNEANNANLRLLHLSSQKLIPEDNYLNSKYEVLTAGPRYNGLVYWIEIDLPEEEITSERDALLKKKPKSA